MVANGENQSTVLGGGGQHEGRQLERGEESSARRRGRGGECEREMRKEGGGPLSTEANYNTDRSLLVTRRRDGHPRGEGDLGHAGTAEDGGVASGQKQPRGFSYGTFTNGLEEPPIGQAAKQTVGREASLLRRGCCPASDRGGGRDLLRLPTEGLTLYHPSVVSVHGIPRGARARMAASDQGWILSKDPR